MLKRYRTITGIYLGQPAIDVVTISLHKGGIWMVDRRSAFQEDTTGPPVEQVRLFLSRVKPHRRRLITFAIPRDRIFFRELEFHDLTPEEAISAVRMGIDLHAHLKQENIYFDVWEMAPHQTPGNTGKRQSVRLLLAYVERTFLDPLIKVVQETGHGRSMGCISPVSCGIDGLLRMGGAGIFPCSVLSRQEDEIVISVHSARSWEGSHSVSLFSKAGIARRLADMSRLYPPEFRRLITSPVFRVGDFQLSELEKQPADICEKVRGVSELCKDSAMSMGLCAAGIGLKSFPELSFQSTPRKKPFRIRINTFQLLAVIAAVIMLALTGISSIKVMKLSASAEHLDKKIAHLENSLKPFIKIRTSIEELHTRKRNLLEFKKEVPDLLEVLKDLANLVPQDTWIKNFSLSNNKIRISAEGKSATACVASLRKSRSFSQVKLVSSVTKTRNEMERFSLEIIPKKAGGKKK